MSRLNGETQEELDTLLAAGWAFQGGDSGGWIGVGPGHRPIRANTLELAVRAAYLQSKRGVS